MKEDLLFYHAYEQFYAMAAQSRAFQSFCADAFGEDFSQDGFSDRAQIDMILPYIPRHGHAHILDIGCGNGKMLGYLQRRTGAHIHGFDYSEEAIQTARKLFREKADFREGVIGQIDYPAESFDVITSMDTMYFAPDMHAFTAQIKRWLKPDGVFFVGYQEGDVIPRTADAHSTTLAAALRDHGMPYEVTDLSQPTYDLLRAKRAAALRHQPAFEAEGNAVWFDLLIGQTECAMAPFDQFARQMARYIYVIRKSHLPF